MTSQMVSWRRASLLVVSGLFVAACQPAQPAATATPPPKPAAPTAAAPSPAAAASPIASPLASPAASPSPSPMSAAAGSVKLEWLGWSFFRFTSPTGKVILTNPFIQGNPDAALRVDDITEADLILVPNAHGDEVGSTVAIAQKTGARTLQPFELGTFFMQQGLPSDQVIRSNPGNRLRWEGITIRLVNSIHGSGSGTGTNTEVVPSYGGPAAGFYITFENGWTVYFTGSSAATQDQALWASMYKPDAMIFHMGTGTEPMDVAMMIKLTTTDNPNLKTLMPHHHRVMPPPGSTTVAEVQAALAAMGVNIPITDQLRTQVYEFSK